MDSPHFPCLTQEKTHQVNCARLLMSQTSPLARQICSSIERGVPRTPIHGRRFRRCKRFGPVERRSSSKTHRQQNPTEGTYRLWTNRRGARFS